LPASLLGGGSPIPGGLVTRIAAAHETVERGAAGNVVIEIP